MTPTGSADDFNTSHPHRTIGFLSDGSWESFKKCGPTTSRIELALGRVQWRLTPSTFVDTFLKVLIILSRPGSFSS
jgi:hypothetical protein